MKVSQQQYVLPMGGYIKQLDECDQEDTAIVKIALFNKAINSINHRRYVFNKSYIRRGSSSRRSKIFIKRFTKAHKYPINYQYTSSSIAI
jgi:hypothetical protein